MPVMTRPPGAKTPAPAKEAAHHHPHHHVADHSYLNSGPNVVERTAVGGLSSVNGAFGKVVNMTWMLGMAASAAGLVGKVPVLGKPFDWASRQMTKPQDFMNNTSLGDLSMSKSLGKLSEVVSDTTGRFDAGKKVASRIGGAATAPKSASTEGDHG